MAAGEAEALACVTGAQEVNYDKNSDEEGTSHIAKDAANDECLDKFPSWLQVPKVFGADYANFLASVTAGSGDAGGVKQGSACLAGYWKHHPAKLLQLTFNLLSLRSLPF